MKVDKRLVAYASTIKGFGRQDILDSLMENKTNRVQLGNMERPSRSLELLAKYVKTEGEASNIVVDDSERIQWNPNSHIRTESGKAWYYEMLKEIELLGQTKLQQLLVEMANMKFKIERNENE